MTLSSPLLAPPGGLGRRTGPSGCGPMILLPRLQRDEASFVKADQSMPRVLEFAARRQPWQSPQSVGVVDGVGMVVLSKDE